MPIKSIKIINILFLIPNAKSITVDIKKYIITIPVSGSRNVKILGKAVISITDKKIFKSVLKVKLLLYFCSKYLKTFTLVIISILLISFQ